MLTFNGESTGRFCDGVSRRNFLQVGSLGFAGLTLPNLLRAKDAATKAGAEGMARSLARELGSRSITVNCVAPGFIDPHTLG